MKLRHLGSTAAAARGIEATGATNASPVVLTLTAGHNQRVGDRIGVFGITGNTGANGIWTISARTATTATLEGSVGNGTATMTKAVVTCVMDRTPFLRGHSAVAYAHRMTDQVAADLTFAVMGSRPDDNDSPTYLAATDTRLFSGDYDEDDLGTLFEDVTTDGPDIAFGTPGATNDGIDEMREVQLRRHMYLNVSAYTAGGIEVDILC